MQPPSDAQHAIDQLRAIGGDELVREMAATFAHFATTQVERLSEACDAGDLELVATMAHALYASSRQMGVGALADAASSAEVAGHGGDPTAVEQAVSRARRALADARQWLDVLAAT